MKLLNKTFSTLLVVTMLFTMFSVNVFAEVTAANVTIEKATVEVGTATVDIDVDVAAVGSGSVLDYLTLELDVDDGLKLKSIVLPTEYQDTSAFTNNSNADVNLIYIQTTYDKSVNILANSKFVCTFEITDPTLEKTYNIGLVEGTNTDMSLDSSFESYPVALAQAGSVTVEAAAPEVEVTWDYAIDAVLGGMRWLFDATVENGTLEETKVRFVKGNNIEAEIAGVEMSGTAATFGGDIENVPENATGTYYAVGFAKVNGEWYPSEVLANSPYAAN